MQYLVELNNNLWRRGELSLGELFHSLEPMWVLIEEFRGREYACHVPANIYFKHLFVALSNVWVGWNLGVQFPLQAYSNLSSVGF